MQRLERAERVGPAVYALRLRQQLANLIGRAHTEALKEDRARAARKAAVVPMPLVAVEPVESSAEAEAAVVTFREAVCGLLDVAGEVGEEDGDDVAEMLFVLATWWAPEAREEDAEGEGADVFEFPPSPGDEAV